LKTKVKELLSTYFIGMKFSGFIPYGCVEPNIIICLERKPKTIFHFSRNSRPLYLSTRDFL